MADTMDLSAFKHAVVPIAVVIGLGVARIVSAVSDYTQHRDRTRFALAHGLWTAILFLLMVGLWWIVWGLRHVDESYWSFFTLIFLLAGPCFLFMAAGLMLPPVPDEGVLDLGMQIEEVGRAFFLCLAGFVGWLMLVEVWLLEQPAWSLPTRPLQLTAIGLFGTGAVRPTRPVATLLGAIVISVLVVVLATVRARLV